MKLKEAFKYALENLGDPREASYLLSGFLGGELSRLFSHPGEELQGSPGEIFRWVELRKRGVPLAYISHKKEFFGRIFYIDRRVLIPRPETELLIEETLNSVKEIWGNGDGEGLTFLDLGTGSGVIAVTIALELPKVRVIATDISEEALEVAKKNAMRFGVEDRITFIEGDLFSPIKEPLDGILANLPYVGEDWVKGSPELSFEPERSLLGGKRGVETVIRMLEDAPRWLKRPGFLIAEIGEGENLILKMAEQAFPAGSISLIPDLQGLPRLLKIKIKNGDSPHFHFLGEGEFRE